MPLFRAGQTVVVARGPASQRTYRLSTITSRTDHLTLSDGTLFTLVGRQQGSRGAWAQILLQETDPDYLAYLHALPIHEALSHLTITA